MWEYQVAGIGMKVVTKWFGYRKRKPAGRRSSLLDDITPETWPTHFTSELLRLLNVIGRCVDI
ncbi:type ISP restriction/modification enzyme [Streptomyces asiaticus]